MYFEGWPSKFPWANSELAPLGDAVNYGLVPYADSIPKETRDRERQGMSNAELMNDMLKQGNMTFDQCEKKKKNLQERFWDWITRNGGDKK